MRPRLAVALAVGLGMGLAAVAGAITTANNLGDKVEWTFKVGDAVLPFWQYSCEYAASQPENSFLTCEYHLSPWPSVGVEMRGQAKGTPGVLPPAIELIKTQDTQAVGVCFLEEYGDCRGEGSCTPPETIEVEDRAFFYPNDPGYWHGQIRYRREFVTQNPLVTYKRWITIDLYLYNTELCSIKTLEWLKGRKRASRYWPANGGGPGH